MREPIENEYFNWLCAKVLEVGANNFYDLLRILHTTEFVWVVPADRHRARDGVELREDFAMEVGIERDLEWEMAPCSMLEFFIAFAKRASFQTDMPVKDWFWEFLVNLKLDGYSRVFDSDRPVIEDILYNFIWRQYDPSGDGGMFPMMQTRNDQRKIEIWYQFSEYVQDRGLF